MFYNSLNRFKDNDHKNRALEVQILIEAAFKITREQFWIRKNETISAGVELRTFYRYLNRRLKGEPIAYILGKKEFFGETFYVNQNVLIPRPETEILVEKAIQLSNDLPGEPLGILDIGAGSGNISILLAKHFYTNVTAVETSEKALYVLKKNLRFHRVADRVQAVRADLFPPSYREGCFDMIVSNPPYVPEGEWQKLEPSVRDYEPKIALVGGEDGLEVIRPIVEKAPQFLKPQGKLLLEIGYNLYEPVKQIFARSGFSSFQFIKDYNQIYRVVIAHLEQ
ncbi:MAG: peptide chain release factor N(5)-glutamine methyltransferase [Candidatus Aminicenantes bacterium]|nr:peptide chain release factor N(5)-glutamine methyltransferase [Candidatus Aminicenantes bacterium]